MASKGTRKRRERERGRREKEESAARPSHRSHPACHPKWDVPGPNSQVNETVAECGPHTTVPGTGVSAIGGCSGQTKAPVLAAGPDRSFSRTHCG